MIENIVTYVVQQLVEHSTVVKVAVAHEEGNSSVIIYVADSDFKRVIGKDGKIVKSLRALVNALDPRDYQLVINPAQ